MVRVPSRGVDQFNLRFPDGMREKIARAAERNGRSMNAEILTRLEQSFAGEGRTPQNLGDGAADVLVAAFRTFDDALGAIGEAVKRHAVEASVRPAGDGGWTLVEELHASRQRLLTEPSTETRDQDLDFVERALAAAYSDATGGSGGLPGPGWQRSAKLVAGTDAPTSTSPRKRARTKSPE